MAQIRKHRRYQELEIQQKLGLIRDLKTQVPFELTPKIEHERASFWIADFTYEELIDGEWINRCEDCKGYRTPLYILKRKIIRWRYGIEILETKPPRAPRRR